MIRNDYSDDEVGTNGHDRIVLQTNNNVTLDNYIHLYFYDFI